MSSSLGNRGIVPEKLVDFTQDQSSTQYTNSRLVILQSVYRYLFLVSQRDHGWKRPINLTRSYSNDPRGSVLNSLWSWTAVAACVHDGDPLLNSVQGAERVVFEATDGQREHVHPVMDGVVDGREHACTGARPAFSPQGLVHGNAGAGRAATRSACGEPWKLAASTTEPAVVEAVFVPWVSMPRGDR